MSRGDAYGIYDPNTRVHEGRDPLKQQQVWNDLQIDQWDDGALRDSANEHDEFWNQHNFDVEHYIDKTQEEEDKLRQKVE